MLIALTIVSVWALLDPWRGSDDQISIVPLSPLPDPPPHAASARTAIDASTPSLRMFIQFSPHKSPVESTWQAPDWEPERTLDALAAVPRDLLRWSARRRWCVTGSGCKPLVRAARRWPPKRCRIISRRRTDCNTGRPHPSARRERPSLAADEGSASPVRPRVESPVGGERSPALRGAPVRRGIPGPSSPCHGHRSARRLE